MQQAAMTPVGSYVRDLGASLTRMIENTLDWEHLPYLHARDFATIRVVDADASGWVAETTLPGRPDDVLMLDLRLHPGRDGWTTRTMRGGEPLAEIVTHVTATGARSCRVSIDFHLAGVTSEQAPAIGAYYRTLYARLYDEDEAMMIARQHSLDTPDRSWRTVGGHRLPNACPHLGLPLTADPDADGIVTCPWHGYRFEAATGICVSGGACRWDPPAASLV